MPPDLVCFEDLDLLGRETSDELEILEQDLYHRLLETYGSNPDDRDRGAGIGSMLSGALEDLDPRGAIETDFTKDPRVSRCRATITPIPGVSGGFRIQIEVQALDSVIPIEATWINGVLTRVRA